MLFTIEQSRLLKTLQIVERAVNDRSALPILANILLEITDRELVCTATDLDVGVRYQLPLANVTEPGTATLPARRLSALVRELPEELVTVEAKKNHAATVSCGSSQFRIPGLPPEDFPTFPVLEQAAGLEISAQVLRTMITQTAFAMSMEETRFVLNGALVKYSDATITLAATDGRRLAVASTTVPPARTSALQVIVPSKAIRELGRLLQDSETDEVRIVPLQDNQLLFRFGGITVLTRLVDGQFPQYDNVIPQPSPTTIQCDRAVFASAVRRVSLMTTATSQAVVFELSKDRLVISKDSPELGSAREELPAAYQGAPATIAFNPEYWLDVLKVLESADVTIEVSAPDKPAVIRLPGFLYIVLPMKLA